MPLFAPLHTFRHVSNIREKWHPSAAFSFFTLWFPAYTAGLLPVLFLVFRCSRLHAAQLLPAGPAYGMLRLLCPFYDLRLTSLADPFLSSRLLCLLRFGAHLSFFSLSYSLSFLIKKPLRGRTREGDMCGHVWYVFLLYYKGADA